MGESRLLGSHLPAPGGVRRPRARKPSGVANLVRSARAPSPIGLGARGDRHRWAGPGGLKLGKSCTFAGQRKAAAGILGGGSAPRTLGRVEATARDE